MQTKLIFFPDFSIIIGKMKKVKAFFSVFLNSILPHEPYYSKILHLRFSQSLKYFFSILTIIYMILVIKGASYLRLDLLNTYRECVSRTIAKFPDNYNIYLSRGILSTNADRPFFVWLSCDKNHPTLFAVIDERGKIENFHSYQTKILVTGNDVAYGSGVFLWKRHLNTLSDPSTKYTKHNLSQLNSILFNVLDRYLPYAIIALVILAPLILAISGFMLVGLVSIFTALFYRLFNRKYHIKKIFQLGLHAATLPLLLFSCSFSLYLLYPITAILSFILFVIFHIAAVYEAHYRH